MRWASMYSSNPRNQLTVVCIVYLIFCVISASEKLDGDEFAFISEPYEMLGGDYTVGYFKDHEYLRAIETIAKAYFLYWQYRPLFSPIVSKKHQSLFKEEEQRHGYVTPPSVEKGDANALSRYQARQIVPDPNRFYRQGAGKPLLPAILSIPQLVVIALISSGKDLLKIQFSKKRHPLFILTRLAQIISGLIVIIMIYAVVKQEFGKEVAILAAATLAFCPVTIEYFSDLHHDAIMVPFVLGASYLSIIKGRYVVAGIVYGLALASKNAAIFLVPALIVYFLLLGYKIYRENGCLAFRGYVIEKGKQLVLFGALALVTLTPFANPVSYIEEILTPITHREFDVRGADVSKFTLSRRLKLELENENVSKVAGGGVIRGVLRIRKILGFNSIFILFSILGFFLCLQSIGNPISRFSLIMLLMVLPYGLVFEYAVSYRSLMYLPFFAILCADVLNRRNLASIALLFLFVTLLYSAGLLIG